MKTFQLEVRCPAGSVLVGGYSAVPEGLDAVHARTRSGDPVLPATSVRGALRETLEGLLRAIGRPACSGGDGRDPSDDSGPDRPCTLDGGRSCLPCRVFGTQTAQVPDGQETYSLLVLGEGVMERRRDSEGRGLGGTEWTRRHGVAIARTRRSAADKRLYDRLVPAVSGELRFVCEGRLSGDDPDVERALGAAVTATTHLGGGRSRGTGRVDMRLAWTDESGARAALPGDGDLRLRLRLLAPANIGVPLNAENLRETRREIPGSALRGAIGFALAERLSDPNDDEPFQRLVAEDGATFDFLYLSDASAPASARSGPWPVTARACKHAPHEHGAVDTLLDRIAVRLAGDVDAATRVEETSLRACGHPGCGGALRAPIGTRAAACGPPLRTVTRVSLDRRRSSAREGRLFSNVMLDAGATFDGCIRNIPPESRQRLAQALAAPLSIGRGRSMGWGRVEVTVLSPEPDGSLDQRGRAFDRALEQALDFAGVPTDRVGHLVPLTLLSPFLPGDEDGRATLLAGLQGVKDPSWLLVARRFDLEGGWDQRAGEGRVERCVRAGAVYVLDLGAARWSDPAVAEWLAGLEASGAGDRRYQGYGRVLAFDPFITRRRFDGVDG